MKEKYILSLSFLLFIIIILSIICYPLFSIEYFCNCSKKDDLKEKIHVDKENNYDTYLENIEFSPNCCPSLISSSTGCACFDKPLKSLIINRGSNKCY